MGLMIPSLVVRGTKKKAKNHHLVILGILAIQLDKSFCASIPLFVVRLHGVKWALFGIHARTKRNLIG